MSNAFVGRPLPLPAFVRLRYEFRYDRGIRSFDEVIATAAIKKIEFRPGFQESDGSGRSDLCDVELLDTEHSLTLPGIFFEHLCKVLCRESKLVTLDQSELEAVSSETPNSAAGGVSNE